MAHAHQLARLFPEPCDFPQNIVRYFKGSLSIGPIRMALKEYRESGKLAAWHAAHNPKAAKSTAKPLRRNQRATAFRDVGADPTAAHRMR